MPPTKIKTGQPSVIPKQPEKTVGSTFREKFAKLLLNDNSSELDWKTKKRATRLLSEERAAEKLANRETGERNRSIVIASALTAMSAALTYVATYTTAGTVLTIPTAGGCLVIAGVFAAYALFRHNRVQKAAKRLEKVRSELDGIIQKSTKEAS